VGGMIKLIKKINKIFASIINFILSAIIYFLGGGLSFIFYILSKKEKKKFSYWNNEKLNENYERQA